MHTEVMHLQVSDIDDLVSADVTRNSSSMQCPQQQIPPAFTAESIGQS